jgi:hypothetical protein
MTDLPLACTLDAHAAAGRRQQISRLWSEALIATERTPAGVRVRLRNSPEIERRARELIAAEARCCAFLVFDLRAADEELVLEITGPDDARAVIDDFFEPAAA